jgi:hypothetical protein
VHAVPLRQHPLLPQNLRKRRYFSDRGQAISAITLAAHDMRRAAGFCSSLGFEIDYGSENALMLTHRPD